MTDPVEPATPADPADPDPDVDGAPAREQSASTATGRHRKGKRAKQGSFWQELPFLILIAIVFALLIKSFVVQAFFIPSGSMENTLRVRDRVLVNKMVYRLRDIHRGEIVVFNGLDSFTPETTVRPPGNALESARRKITSLFGFGAPGEKDFIKRVIGLPGDEVMCCTNGHVTVNGKELDESSYLFEDDARTFGPVTVPKGRLWVMGDHRGASNDSRAYVHDEHMGTVPINKVIGRAFVVIYPPGHIRGLKVPRPIERVGAPLLSPGGLGLAAAIPVARWRRRRRLRRA